MRSSGNIGSQEQQSIINENKVQQGDGSDSRGSVRVVGLGPGSFEDMSFRAKSAIIDADIVVGYDTYLSLVKTLLVGKTTIGSGMMQEIERCQAAVNEALSGKRVTVISSGDPGIYGMAGLILELAMKYDDDIRPDVEVVPGISAVSAAAAILGAPLMHDFAVISLSDLLTPWEVIQKRIKMAAEGDFVSAFYNPKSTRRVTQIEEVREVMLKVRKPDTPVGIVKNASREGQTMVISTLENFTKEYIDMFSIVIIGNSQTYVKNGRMITPRGYIL